MGHLNLAEAVLDMASGGPLSTDKLLEQIELHDDVNPKLVEFSLDLALQEDQRFDEIGPAGDVLWFLRRLDPPMVLETPLHLRYLEIDYDRSVLTSEMLSLEQALDDELSPPTGKMQTSNEVEVRLIYPHLRSGTLPLSARLRHLFPTAYEGSGTGGGSSMGSGSSMQGQTRAMKQSNKQMEAAKGAQNSADDAALKTQERERLQLQKQDGSGSGDPLQIRTQDRIQLQDKAQP